MPKTVLKVNGLRVVRSGAVILDGIDWQVRAGEHWVMLGANGSGKTSLLSALTGYLMPTEGEVEVLGERYGDYDWRELRCRVGLVSSSIRQQMADDEPALATVVSGKYSVIDLWQAPTAVEQREARKILAQVECSKLAGRRWGVLSQGERQRVLIGRALMAKPELLILDEPCAGLDPAAREHFLQFLQRMGSRRGGPALILVTHHVEEVMPVFTHAVVLRGGRVLASGRKGQVLSSAILSRAFGARMRLRRVGRRYRLSVAPNRAVVV